MVEQVEISSLDLRYENYRLKSQIVEDKLLASIINHDIREPLQGIDTKNSKILLDGFKRLRCAKKLNINTVPYSSLCDDEQLGIIELIRISNSKSLNILEQAILIDNLLNVHKMCSQDIARLLEKSKSWVSMRKGIIGEMSEYVMKTIFAGDFPAYCFMYTLRQFIRMNSIPNNEIDEFVKSVAGKGLSIRDIEILANAYFKGSDDFREQIKTGNIAWGLKQLKESYVNSKNYTIHEQSILNDFENVQKYMHRIIYRTQKNIFDHKDFCVQINLITGGILRIMDNFSKTIRDYHDRCEQA